MGVTKVHIAAVGRFEGPVTKVINYIGGIDKLYLLFTENENTDKAGNIEDRIRTVDKDGSTNTMIDYGTQNFSNDGNKPMGGNGKPVASGSRDIAEKIEKSEQNKIPFIRLRRIPMFDFDGICDVISEIYKDEKGPDVEFSMNITGGTNLMAAATCYMSYYICAQMYYAGNQKAPISEQVDRIGQRTAVDIEKMHPMTKRILKIMYEETKNGNPITITEINGIDNNISIQKANYHTGLLKKMELIEDKAYIETKSINEKTVKKVNNRKAGLVITRLGAMIVAHIM